MKIIISPAKKMNFDDDSLEYKSLPYFIEKAEELVNYFKTLSFNEAKEIWKCSDDIAKLNYERFSDMDLRFKLTPALFAYEGIQYKYMCPSAFETDELDYIEKHLVILSGLYGALKPFDGVVSYRLEMQAALKDEKLKSLYKFWGNSLADYISAADDTIINLASKEYSKAVVPHLEGKHVIDFTFGELKDGKVIEKGTQVKMARGEIVRFMAETKCKSVDELKQFDRLGYSYCNERSEENKLVFLK